MVKHLAFYDALYVGNVDRMTATSQQGPITHPAQYNGGIVGAGARAWLGKPPVSGENRVRLHVPLPADISTMSADLLFSEPPRMVLPESIKREGDVITRSAQQQRVEDIINSPEFHATLLEAAEVQSALGGVYLRLIWDRNRLRSVRADVVHADCAMPEFRFGELSAVTFWTELSSLGDDFVYRHLERVEPGFTEHGLYKGGKNTLGVRVPIEEHPSTSWLAAPGVLNEESQLLSGIDRMTAVFIPNMLPNKEFRKHPLLRSVGRSDYAGAVQIFDAADETWSSWMRDIRLAKARLIVPRDYLTSNGFGGGSSFDLDREVYEGIDALTGPNGESIGITPQQFAIRVDEHERTLHDLQRRALRAAGYSSSSMGDTDAGMRTATEVKSDDRLSDRTRDKKTNYWRRIDEFCLTWLLLDAELYNLPKPEKAPEVRFPAESQVDVEETSRVIQMLSAATAISTQQKVRMMHPEWDGTTVNEETDRILQEKGISTDIDPTKVTGVPGNTPSPADVERMRKALEED
jgi:A118 family predicted phage portal protein